MAFCLECNQRIPAPADGTLLTQICSNCGQRNGVANFPALAKARPAAPPALPGEALAEGEAVCFYSPNRRATTSCDHCGVLISEPWAAAWGTETVCLKCLEHLREEKRDARFISQRTLWDNIALTLALAPLTLIFWWAVFVTAPAALILALRHWNTSRGMVPRGRFRLVATILLSLLQIGGVTALFMGLWSAISDNL